MDTNIHNLLNQGYARENGYKNGYLKGIEDGITNGTALFDKQRILTTAEANKNTYRNATLISSGPGYGLYDQKTGLLSIFTWQHTMETLIKSYTNDSSKNEDAVISDIATILTTKYSFVKKSVTDNSDKFTKENERLFKSDWFGIDASDKKLANFEEAFLYAPADRKLLTRIDGFDKDLRGLKFGSLTLMRIEKDSVKPEPVFMKAAKPPPPALPPPPPSIISGLSALVSKPLFTPTASKPLAASAAASAAAASESDEEEITFS
jgi:hypothetical protein